MGNYALFLTGIKKRRAVMALEKKEQGEIHKRLVLNQCPKCRNNLSILEKTVEKIVRRCGRCLLTISDTVEAGEFPKSVCD